MKKMYKDGTTLAEILRDGWSRDFSAEQTREEAKVMGFLVTKESIIEAWCRMDDEFEYNCRPYTNDDQPCHACGGFLCEGDCPQMTGGD
jgi:hypothetical protein